MLAEAKKAEPFAHSSSCGPSYSVPMRYLVNRPSIGDSFNYSFLLKNDIRTACVSQLVTTCSLNVKNMAVEENAIETRTEKHMVPFEE